MTFFEDPPESIDGALEDLEDVSFDSEENEDENSEPVPKLRFGSDDSETGAATAEVEFPADFSLERKAEEILEKTAIKCTVCGHLVNSPFNEYDHNFQREAKHDAPLVCYHVSCPENSNKNGIVVDTKYGIVTPISPSGAEQFKITIADEVKP